MGCQLGKAAERWALLDSGNCGGLTGRGRAQLSGLTAGLARHTLRTEMGHV